MKKSVSLTAILALIILCSYDVPTGWFAAGSKPKSYEMGIDKGAAEDGKNCATIKSIDKSITGFGTLMQECLPTTYLGKRVRMTGVMKSKDVTGWAGLWFRVDQANSTKSLSFDNMADRPIKGTTTWTKCEIVLDVPATASMLAYGALLDGTGQIWFDNMKFEIVDNTVPLTGGNKDLNKVIQDAPVNLDFEK
jgi:hypothetical protein